MIANMAVITYETRSIQHEHLT